MLVHGIVGLSLSCLDKRSAVGREEDNQSEIETKFQKPITIK